MSIAEAIISGIVQGLTEFLPISSSGHLVILHHYFGHKNPQLFFDICLHIGTLFSILVYFWRDIIEMVRKKRHLLWLIIVGSFPTAVVAFILHNKVERLFADVRVVGYMLIVTAVILFIGTYFSKRRANVDASERTLGWRKAFIIGAVQGVAIIPGISRSGSTIGSGLMLGLDKNEAVRYSFLLAIPAILGALGLKLQDATSAMVVTPDIFFGTLSAFLVGLVSISFLLRVVFNDKLWSFGVYCMLVGALAILI